MIFTKTKYFLLLFFVFTVSFHFLNGKEHAYKSIAITQIIEHPSADKTRMGVLDGLKDAGFIEGDNLKVYYDSAQGNLGTAVQIAKKYTSLKPDLIIPITTPSAQTVVAAAKGVGIPVVFAAVTDPLHAHIVTSMKNGNEGVSGASDYPPIQEQIKLIKAIFPYAKTVGILYSAGETNSVKMVQSFIEMSHVFTLNTVEATVINTHQVSTAIRSLIGKVDVIYVPLDNTVLSAMESVIKIAIESKIPLFTSDPDSVKQGALASVSHTQYDTGYLAGGIAARILNGENPKDICVAIPSKTHLILNKETAQKINITFPPSVLDRAGEIIDKNPQA